MASDPTPQPVQPSEEALDRYLAGEASGAEQAAVEVWLAARPASTRRIAALRLAARFPVRPPSDDKIDALVRGFESRVAADKAAELRVAGRRRFLWGSQRSKRRVLPLAMTAAAAIVVLAVITSRKSVAPPAPSTYSTEPGQTRTVTLSDESHIVLNVATRVTVTEDQSAGRVVRVDGEALFRVAPSHAPLVVVARNTTARVLGTEFGVRAYSSDDFVRVAVRSGKVSAQSQVLEARDILDVGPNGHITIRHDANVDAALSFASGVLTVEGKTFAEARGELERWYDAEIQIADERLARQVISAQIAAGPRDDLRRLLAPVLRARATVSGRVVTFTSP